TCQHQPEKYQVHRPNLTHDADHDVAERAADRPDRVPSLLQIVTEKSQQPLSPHIDLLYSLQSRSQSLIGTIVLRAPASLQRPDLAAIHTEAVEHVPDKLQARLELRVHHLGRADVAQHGQTVAGASGHQVD